MSLVFDDYLIIKEFEEWLIEDGVKPKGSPFLRDLIRRLLKGCYRKRSVK